MGSAALLDHESTVPNGAAAPAAASAPSDSSNSSGTQFVHFSSNFPIFWLLIAYWLCLPFGDTTFFDISTIGVGEFES